MLKIIKTAAVIKAERYLTGEDVLHFPNALTREIEGVDYRQVFGGTLSEVVDYVEANLPYLAANGFRVHCNFANNFFTPSEWLALTLYVREPEVPSVDPPDSENVYAVAIGMFTGIFCYAGTVEDVADWLRVRKVAQDHVIVMVGDNRSKPFLGTEFVQRGVNDYSREE